MKNADCTAQDELDIFPSRRRTRAHALAGMKQMLSNDELGLLRDDPCCTRYRKLELGGMCSSCSCDISSDVYHSELHFHEVLVSYTFHFPRITFATIRYPSTSVEISFAHEWLSRFLSYQRSLAVAAGMPSKNYQVVSWLVAYNGRQCV